MRIAVSFASMSARFCSTGPPFMPDPTMLMKARTRVRDAIDHLFLELREIPPSRPARIHQRRLAAPEGVRVGLHGAVGVAQIRVLLGAEEHVGVDVDEAGHHVEPGRVDDPHACGRLDVGGDTA